MATKVETLIQEIQQLPSSDREHLLEEVLKSLQVDVEAHDLAELKMQYPNEWLAVIMPEGEDQYDPKRGYLVAHSPDKVLLWQQVVNLPSNDNLYVFFNGSATAKGFGIIFHDTTDTPVITTVGD